MNYPTLSLCLALILSACTPSTHLTLHTYSSEVESALSGELIPGHQIDETELFPLDLFSLTDEMKHFAVEATRSGRTQDQKAELLHTALLMPVEKGGRGIRYSVSATAIPADVFASRQANCLSHSILYVAMARYIGLNAYVNQVVVPPLWYMEDHDSFLLMKHVNAKIKLRSMPWVPGRDGRIKMMTASDIVIDLDMRRFRSTYKQILLDEPAVEALFYNNRAMELLAEGKILQSFLYLKRALQIKPEEVFIWSNLGSLYRRQGNLHIAEAVYRHALSYDVTDLTVLHNLSGLYKQMGRTEESVAYQTKVQRYRESNPYYLYQMAIHAKNKGDWNKAEKFIQRALVKQKTDERFYVVAAEVYEHQGLIDKANKMRKKAQALGYQDLAWQLTQ